MRPGLATASLDEFAFRLLNWTSEGWLVLVVEDDLKASDVAVRITHLLQALGTEAVALVTVTSADSLVHSVRQGQAPPGAPTVSCGYERFRAEHWRQVDLARSALATDLRAKETPSNQREAKAPVTDGYQPPPLTSFPYELAIQCAQVGGSHVTIKESYQ